MPNFSVSVSTSGDTTILAADTTAALRDKKVTGLFLKAAAATTVQLVAVPVSGSEILLTGAIPMTPGDFEYLLPMCSPGQHWFRLAPTYSLKVRNGSAVVVAGHGQYEL